MEFNEDDLDNVVGGMSYDAAIEIAKKHPGFLRDDAEEQDELTEEQLMNLKAGYPYGLDEENKPKTR